MASAGQGSDRARTTDSFFFALIPDEAACAQIIDLTTRLLSSHPLKARPVPAERLHVTLHYLGAFDGVPPDILRDARDAALSIALPPVTVTLDRIESFAGRRAKRPLVLAGDADDSITALEQALGAALDARGLVTHRHPRFTPHITLLYDEHRVAREPVAPIRVVAREFALVRSLLGRSRHQTLARWPLA